MAYSSKNPKFTTEILTDQTSTAGTNPPTGSHRFFNRNGSLTVRNSAGVESPVSVRALKNYVNNPDDAYLTWTASGAGVTLATTTTTANIPDNITKLTALDIVRVSGTTDFVRYRFTLDQTDYSRTLSIYWNQLYAGSSGDYVVEMWSNTLSNYTGTSAQLSLSTANIPASNGTFTSTFTSPTSSAPYMELRIRVAAGTTHLYLGNVAVTPGVVLTAATATETVAGLVTRMNSYRPGTTYNSVALTVANVSGLGSFTPSTDSFMIPYQTVDGSWHLRFSVQLNSTSNVTNGTFSIAGVNFKGTTSGLQQAVAVVGVSGPVPASGYTIANTANIFIVGTGSEINWSISGDVELNSKPTWAN